MNIFSFITMIICRPFGWVLSLCYRLGNNYGLAILLFTIITRIFLLPLAIKQQRSTAEMVRMAPKLENLRKKYGKDQKRLNEETMNLYKEENYSPFGGCLPMLIQIPIIWVLFTIIYQPLTYIVGMSQENIQKVVNLLHLTQAQNSRRELYAAEHIDKFADKLTFLPAHTLHINFNLFNLDLSQTPSVSHIDALILIPIVCYITSLLSSWLSMKLNAVANTQQTKSMNISMLLMMPLVSAWFSLQVPAGVGFYWICTNLFMIAQVLLLNKFYNPKKLAEESEERAMQRRVGKIADTNPDTETETPDTQEDTGSEENTDQKTQKTAKSRSQKNTKLSKKQLKEADKRRLSASRAAENEKTDDT